MISAPFVPLESEWIGSLKPTAGNVPAYEQDGERYSEIQYFRIKFREEDFLKRAEAVASLYHTYVPYPLLLLLHTEASYRVEAAPKSIPAETGVACTHIKTYRSPAVDFLHLTEAACAFKNAMAFSQLAAQDVKTTYNSYLTAITHFAWTMSTGAVTEVADPEAHYVTLEQIQKLERHRESLTSQLRKSKRMTERVELQIELSSLIQQLKDLKAQFYYER